MEGEQPFPARAAQALENRRNSIQSDDLPRLKEHFRVFHSSLQGLHQLLIRKGLIQQDPYKSEQKISGIEPPTDDPYLESERDLAIGVRLDAYDNILEFLNNYFEFRLDALGFRELKQLSELTRYISWDQLTSHSTRSTTRGLADVIGRARGGQDGFANSIISDALDQLDRNSKSILDQIKSVATYRREEYKQTLREQLLPLLTGGPALEPDDADSLDRMRKEHASLGLPGPFVPELASELLAEEFGPNAEQLRQQVLVRLQATSEPTRKARPKESLRDVLISAIRGIAAASRSLDTIVDNLRTNTELSRSPSGGFTERFRQWIDKLTNRKPAKLTCTVEYTDEQTGTRQSETIVVDDFLEHVAKKARVYGSFLARRGTPWAKLQKASDEQLYQYVNRELGECHLIHRRAGALDDRLKAKASPADRKKMKGVKIELTALRNAIATSNQNKHEYTAKREELDQMRKLGVDG